MKTPLATLALVALIPAGAAAQSAETVLPDLNYPWAIEAHGDSIYITEKSGTLGIFADGRSGD